MNRLLSVLLLAAACLAQQSASPRLSTAASATPDSLVIPAGTKVLLSLIHPISTKSARVGDGVYLKTSFPVTIEDQMAIPAGTYVQGEITEVKRPGKVKGRAELRFRFNTLIFPSGYTLSLPAAVEDVPAMENAKMKDSEGTIQANGTKGRDAATANKLRFTFASDEETASDMSFLRHHLKIVERQNLFPEILGALIAPPSSPMPKDVQNVADAARRCEWPLGRSLARP